MTEFVLLIISSSSEDESQEIISTLKEQTIVKIYVTAKENEREYTLIIDKKGILFDQPHTQMMSIKSVNRNRMKIIWNEKISRNKQILTLKKLYPELNKVSTVEIYKITKKRRNGNLQRWDGDLLLTFRIKQKKRG